MPESLALRAMCIEQGVTLVACSASLAAQGLTQDDVLSGVELAGMASWLAFAAGAEIQLNFG
jgi:predicted peroxiredoxin